MILCILSRKNQLSRLIKPIILEPFSGAPSQKFANIFTKPLS